ncbi:MAG TPA: cytochrome c biogenesis protein CcsA, partial [Chitinophagaceae bacterium]|nr:cytochrome c biogenesis protein CcsA [Chitinophagaceae bacterium]
NYWMVIHPPVLFLGFASTLIPFAFVVGGLWTREFNSWTKRVLPWALFSAGTLGLGIMMGAAWAYESLNFGGYWAWDPVENASLVPWLVLVAGIHTLLVYRHTGNALRTTALFLIGSQLLVLYSTYLTRSGVLQETSVHAFTGEGITATQLKIFLAALALPSLFVYFRHYKSIPHIVKEEETSSREFWMFVGSLVLFLSAASIIIMTSIPVFNKIVALFTGKESTFKPLAMGEDSAMAYNRIQLFVAVVIGLLSGFGMYLKYKSTGKPFLRKLLLPTAIGAVAAALILIFGDVNFREEGVLYLGAIWLAIVAAVYSVIANGAYLVTGLKGNLRRAGGAIGHVGFGLMLLGILLSSSKKEVLSFNTSGIFVNFGEGSKERPGENLTLIKGVRTDMGKYWVTYVKDSTHPKKSLWYYHLLFERKDGKEQFTLTPNAFVNYKGNEGLMANPDSKHYAGHDIFTYITSLPDPAKNRDTANFRTQSVEVGDTIYYSSGYAILEDLTSRGNIPQAGFAPTDSATLATVKVYGKTGSTYSLESLLVMKNGLPMTSPDTALAESLIVRLDRVNGRQVELAVKESNSVMQYVTLKAYKFPAINVLWIGTILMVIGFFVAAAWRIRSNRQKR